MNEYLNKLYDEERALFKSKNALIDGCTFIEGESPLKECMNLEVKNCHFVGRYPLWYSSNVKCSDSKFDDTARAAIWYTSNATFSSCIFNSPKSLRKLKNVTVEDCSIPNGVETFWWCDGIILKNVETHGDYFGMNSKNMEIENLKLIGQYCFDGTENIHIKNSYFKTKDAFWNSKNIVVEDSYIEGEYFGWNSENVTLIRCKIISHQGFCYMKNIKLIDCVLEKTDLAFEYCSDIDATILSSMDSIKNPINGIIRVKGYNELILDDCDKTKTQIIVD